MKRSRCVWACVWWGPLACGLLGLGLACGAEDAKKASCPATQPIACVDSSGSVSSCCPVSHPVCDPNGGACLASAGAGGGAGTGASGSSGASGAGGGTGGVGATAGESGSAGAGATGGESGNAGAAGLGGGGGGASGGTSGASGASGASGTSGVGGSAGASGTSGAAGTSGTGGSCVDVGFEPNEVEGDAVDLGTVGDCDSAGTAVSAKLDGDTDVDFFGFRGTDGFCVVDPAASTTDPVRLCMFAACAGASVSCALGTSATSGGNSGCCADGGGNVALAINCSGGTDDADVYLRVDSGAAAVCTPYTVGYHY